jgi:hypothetical protein
MLAAQGSRAQMAAVLHEVIEDTEVGSGRMREADLPEHVVAVKLADLAGNLATNRRLASTPDVAARIDRYEQAVHRLQSPLRRVPQRARPDGAPG